MVTLPGATCTSQDVAQRLTSDGYVVVSGLMSGQEVQAARADLGRILAATPTGRNAFEGFDTQRVYALFAKTRTFDRLAVHPLLLGVLDRVLGHYQLSAPVGIRIGPGESAQMLHRDDAIYPLTEPHPPVVVNTMWPLDEFTDENGATRYVPGSHRWEPGRQPAAGDPVLTAAMAPGSAMFYLGSLWHGGGANTTADDWRLGVNVQYCPGFVRQQQNPYFGIPPDTAVTFPDRLLGLLGYKLYKGIMGHVDGKSPGEVVFGDRFAETAYRDAEAARAARK